ncbi:Arf family GTPase CIN4 PWA37_004119 [Arxiozyma heterogenica]|uniref:Arf family GTPase CIN4 n=1 Tax=Arxiozyma heterogenica TaxID=278026 RepID=UPI002EDF1447
MSYTHTHIYIYIYGKVNYLSSSIVEKIMGLLTIIKKQKLKDQEIRCLILGLDNSGKSTIVNQLLPLHERKNNITPTIGFQIQTITLDDSGKQVSLWDIGGQKTLRPFWDNYFDKTDILIWCIDISLPLRFDESFNELKELILRDEGRIGYECKVIVLCNKVDLLLPDDIDVSFQQIKKKILAQLNIDIEDVDSNIKSQKMRSESILFLKCSGITGEGVGNLKKELLIDTSNR